MAQFARITGVNELDDALSYLRDKSAKKIGKSCAGKMATVTAKAIRAYVPASLAKSTMMASDKGIGSRNSKAKISTIQGAKAGVAVGSAYSKVPPLKRQGSGKRRGVGISARNLHWFALGTSERWTGSKRVGLNAHKKGVVARRVLTGKPVHRTGRIDAAKFGGFVQRGAEASRIAAIQAAREKMYEMIHAEAAMARGVGF